jgi:hypothetical protein
VTEKTIADKLAIKPNTKVWLSDAVHLELDGSIATLLGPRYRRRRLIRDGTGARLNFEKKSSNVRCS